MTTTMTRLCGLALFLCAFLASGQAAAQSDLTVVKFHTGNFVQGQTATWTVTVTNIGAAPTSGTVTVTDPMSGPLTPQAGSGSGWTCNVLVGSIQCQRSDLLAPGASYPPLTLTAAIAPNAPPSVLNTVTVSGGGDGNAANNSAGDVASVVPAADLTIAKSHIGNFTQGQPGSYTVTVSNVGGSPTAGLVTVVDNLPAGLVPTAATGTGWNCTVSGQNVNCNRSNPLAPGQSYPAISIAVAVQSNAPASVTNTAVVFGGGENNPANNTANDLTTILAAPDLTIDKAHVGSFLQGQVGANYTLTVANVGASPSIGPVTVSDTVPAGLTPTAAAGAGWTCNIAGLNVICSRSDALAAGASWPAITLTVDVSPAAPPSLSNTASVAGGGDANSANNSDTDVTTTGPGPDLSLTKAHTGNFTQGQVGATYTITASNGGAPTSGAVTITDNVPAGLVPTAATGSGWACTVAGQLVTCTRSDPLASGQSYPPITLTVTVLPAAPASVTNSATITGGGDASPGNNTASDPTTIGPGVDLAIAKTHVGNFFQGQVGATYTITVRNNGFGPSIGLVTMSDTLPVGLVATTAAGTGWSCSVSGQSVGCTRSDALAPGASHPPVTLTVAVAANASASVINLATVAGGSDANTSNNSASDPTTILGGTDLTLTKTHAGTFFRGQQGASYQLTVNNAGAAASTGAVTLTDTVPAGLTATSASGTGWSCAVAGATATCNRSDALAAGASYPVVDLSVDVAANAPPSITNSASISGGGDVNAANNGATDVTAIAAPDLALTKTAIGPFVAGRSAQYVMTVRNDGNGPSFASVSVVDTLPAGMTATSLGGAGWNCTLATLTCQRSDALAAGFPYAPISLLVDVAPNAPANVVNIATVATTGDSNAANDGAQAPTTIAAGATLVGRKTVTGVFLVDKTVNYSIVVRNDGPGPQVDAPGDELIDVLPATLALVSATSSAGTIAATPANNTVRWNGSLAVGSSVTVDITARILPGALGNTVRNQATLAFDGDGNGSNESTSVTDDPGTGVFADPTGFTVGAEAASVPGLPLWVSALLALTVGAIGFAFASGRRERGARAQ